MVVDIEVNFVKQCIRKELQDRLLFELQSPKHRDRAVSRFSHRAENVLSSAFNCVDQHELENFFDSNCEKRQMGYVISWDEADGKLLPIGEAFSRCLYSPTAFLIVADNCVIIKEEKESGATKYWITTPGTLGDIH